MGHGVHDVVEDDAESKSGKFLGILRTVGPLPGVAEVHVGADGDHDAAAIVADGAPLRHIAVFLVSPAGVDIDFAGDLEFLVDVVEDVVDLVGIGEARDRKSEARPAAAAAMNTTSSHLGHAPSSAKWPRIYAERGYLKRNSNKEASPGAA